MINTVFSAIARPCRTIPSTSNQSLHALPGRLILLTPVGDFKLQISGWIHCEAQLQGCGLEGPPGVDRQGVEGGGRALAPGRMDQAGSRDTKHSRRRLVPPIHRLDKGHQGGTRIHPLLAGGVLLSPEVGALHVL